MLDPHDFLFFHFYIKFRLNSSDKTYHRSNGAQYHSLVSNECEKKSARRCSKLEKNDSVKD